MLRLSIRPWILALALAACRNDSDSSELLVQSVSVPDFGLWECNRPIEFVFDERIDFASVSTRSIHIRTSLGVPAAGTFGAKAIDTNGDGVKEGTDERVVVFFPSCAQADDLSDAGLTPGLRYLVTLAGEDSTTDPTAVLRSLSGKALARTVVHAFETIADPALTLHDEKPGAPAPLLRSRGALAGLGCHLELGEDPANRVFFEGSPASGRTPSGFSAPLNLLGDPATHVAVVVVFDQLIRDAPENLARLRLEYNSTVAVSGWRALETRTELLGNCRPGDPAVRLVPLGSFPAGGFVRVHVDAGFEDFVGEATTAPLDAFAIVEVATVAFTSLDPAGAVADELHEEFDFGAESPLSFADPTAPLDAGPAVWGQGELRANHDVVAHPPELSDFDWVVRANETFLFDTTSTDIRGGPDGRRDAVQTATGGFVAVRNLTVRANGRILLSGPNPLVVHASGDVSILGSIHAIGGDSDDLSLPRNPGRGGAGSAGGGAGGSGNRGAEARGGDGRGAFGAGVGGGGGESGFVPPPQSNVHRGGGGGGGRFASDRPPFVAENGGNGPDESRGAESGLNPAQGGAAGPEVFSDGDPSNDFFGIQPIVDASGAVVARRRGELDRIHAGAGGGNGGDSFTADVYPPPPAPALVLEGGGGGGGGGAVVIRALGRIVFGPGGQVRANGGSGGRGFGSAAGGSGSGGHVILESAVAIDFTQGNPLVSPRPWIQALGGPRVVGPSSSRGFGGAGGPGVVQLHVPHPERAPGDPASNLILPDGSFNQPDPLATVCQPRPHVLYRTVRPRSMARSRWIPLGAAGEGSATGAASVVAFLFDGIETAPGEDEGKVRTSSGRVVELAPLLGTLRLAQHGVELLPDGMSLALSGPVLAPLRASAQPISADVYLRTPAVLAGHTLRLANPGEREDFTIADARYDDAASRLTLVLGGLTGTLADTVAGLGGSDAVELTLVPRFFRVREGAAGLDLLPDSRAVRIRFQGASDDGTGHPDALVPLVDWTADVREFGALPPGVLDFVRFQVEFELDTADAGFDPEGEPLALDFLRWPFRF